MKKHWLRAQIKMQLINSIREQVFEKLSGKPVELFYAKQEINKLEEELASFNTNLSKVMKKYSQYLPGFKTTEQVCDNCDSTEIIQVDDVSVCQKCSAIHSFVADHIERIEEPSFVEKNTRSLMKKFRERTSELDVCNERLLRDYEKLAIQVKENPTNRMPNKDFCIFCLLLKNKQVPAKNLTIPNGNAPLVTAATKCKDVFEKLGWMFPSEQVNDYILEERTNKARSSLKKIL